MEEETAITIQTIETTKEPVININMVNNENLEKDFFDKEEE